MSSMRHLTSLRSLALMDIRRAHQGSDLPDEPLEDGSLADADGVDGTASAGGTAATAGDAGSNDDPDGEPDGDAAVDAGDADDSTELFSDSLKELASLSHLTSLEATTAAVDTAAAWQVLASLTAMQRVAVQRMRAASWQLPAAPRITSLTTVGAQGTSHYLSLPTSSHSGGLAALLPSLQQLECICPSNYQLLEALRGHEALQKLKSKAWMRPADGKPWPDGLLSSIMQLQEVTLDGLITSKLSAVLADAGSCEQLRVLRLFQVNGSPGVDYVRAGLRALVAGRCKGSMRELLLG
jgi:hypothetical protein